MTPELVLGGDELEVVVLPELGGRIHRIRAFGADLLRTPHDVGVHDRDPFFWGAYLMAPWCNRIRPAPTRVAGRIVDLRANFPDGTAIHGQLTSRPWVVQADGALTVDGGGDGWPWSYGVAALAQVSGTVLTLDYRLRNASHEPMPAGIGLHPWFVRPVHVRIPAAEVYASNSDSPTVPAPVSGRFDLRQLGAPALGLDGTWTRLATPRIDLEWRGSGVRARLEVDAPRALIALASPETIGANAVEPQTHAPDGLRRLLAGEPEALDLLAPGHELRLGLRLTVERPGYG